MARISTAHFTFDREAFERASLKLKEGMPRAYNDRQVVEALASLLAELRDKNYGDEEIVDVCAAEIAGGEKDDNNKVLRALLRRARAVEAAARGAKKAASRRSKPKLQPSAAPSVIEAGEPSETADDKTREKNDDASQADRQVHQSAPVVASSGGEASQNPNLPVSDARAIGAQRVLEIAARRQAQAGELATDGRLAGRVHHEGGTPPSSGSFGN